jgi:hypothetical protein
MRESTSIPLVLILRRNISMYSPKGSTITWERKRL